MIVPAWIWFVFIFAFGCCIGSFLNVVIYRLPRDKSLIMPPSACPNCDKQIAFYDNIPLVSWLVLAGKCRHCKAPISARYFVIEFITALVFVGLFYLYFFTNIRPGIGPAIDGGWLIYLVHIIMLAAFIAASAIDLQLWVIPISICWLVTFVGLTASGFGVFVIDHARIGSELLLPTAGVKIASLAAGAFLGLLIAWLLLATGIIKRSYEGDEQPFPPEPDEEEKEPVFNDRIEVCKEILFLLPIIICSIAAYRIAQIAPIANWWLSFSQHPVIAGLLGSLWGYFIGCGIVWATRILGTLAFGREAMGLGDVHLMGAAGAVIGPVFVVIAFFVAPFFGLAWAFVQMFSKKIRQIPYGPFLSLGVFTVMILHEHILSYMILMFYSD